jgi:hypothetical protein
MGSSIFFVRKWENKGEGRGKRGEGRGERGEGREERGEERAHTTFEARGFWGVLLAPAWA